MSGQSAELGSLLKVRAIVEPCQLEIPVAGEPFSYADWQVDAPSADIVGHRPLITLAAYSAAVVEQRSFDATA